MLVLGGALAEAPAEGWGHMENSFIEADAVPRRAAWRLVPHNSVANLSAGGVSRK